MKSIKLKKTDIDAACSKGREIASNSENARKTVKSIVSAMSDTSFSGKADLVSKMQKIERRLKSQTERMESYNSAAKLIAEELTAADNAAAKASKNLIGKTTGGFNTFKAAIPLAFNTLTEKVSNIAGMFMPNGKDIQSLSHGVYQGFKDLVGNTNGGKTTSGQTTHAQADPAIDPQAAIQAEEARLAAQESAAWDAKIGAMSNTEGFTQGTKWGDYDTYSNYLGRWESCAAMAMKMRDNCVSEPAHKLFDNESGEHYTAPTELKAGDVVRYFWYSDKENNTGYNQHYIFITKVEGSTIYYGEGNFNTEGNQIVNYGQKDFSEFGGKYDGKLAIQEIWRA